MIKKEDLDVVVGEPHAPSGSVHYEKTDVPRSLIANTPLPFLPPMDSTPVPRSMRITQDMLVKYGYTSSCAKCRSLQRGEAQGTLGHSRECRNRLESAVQDDAAFKGKLEAAEERKAKYLAEEIERSEEMIKREEEGQTQSGTPSAANATGTAASSAPASAGSTGQASRSASSTSPSAGCSRPPRGSDRVEPEPQVRGGTSGRRRAIYRRRLSERLAQRPIRRFRCPRLRPRWRPRRELAQR